MTDSPVFSWHNHFKKYLPNSSTTSETIRRKIWSFSVLLRQTRTSIFCIYFLLRGLFVMRVALHDRFAKVCPSIEMMVHQFRMKNNLVLSTGSRSEHGKPCCQCKQVWSGSLDAWLRFGAKIENLFSEVKYGSAAIFFRIGNKNSRAALF